MDTEDRPEEAPVIDGRVVDFSGLTYVAGVEVGITTVDADGNVASVLTTTDDDGEFVIAIPAGPFRAAHIKAALEGVPPVDLDIEGGKIMPGEVTLVVAADIGSHLRFGA